MASHDIDLLSVKRGSVTAPAGCGKTHLIAEALKRHDDTKPILILTHTNAGVAALRGRLDKAGVPSRAYRLSTIDGWAIRLIRNFPIRAGHNPEILELKNRGSDYPAIREAAKNLLSSENISDVISSTYSRLIVDEYQDCSLPQYAITGYAAKTLPACVLGDPMQAIFDLGGSQTLVDWNKHVAPYFKPVGELSIPWRWKLVGTEPFGRWLLDVRKILEAGQQVDLKGAPPEVCFVALDGTEDRKRQILAGSVKCPTPDGSVLIMGQSTRPQTQRDFAAQIPGAIAIENVDLTDFVDFARRFDLTTSDALDRLTGFAGSVMVNVGVQDLLRRVTSLRDGKARKEASDAEKKAITFQEQPTFAAAADFLAALSYQAGTRTHRPAILRACMKTLAQTNEDVSFHDAAIQIREQNRLLGRPLPRRAVGSTLLLKGLEADVAVILDAAHHSARHLYVAMTRGSRKLVVCSTSDRLN